MGRESELREILSTNDIYFACLMTLAMVENESKYKVTSELAYLLDRETLSDVVKCLGGRTIRIPTEDELKTQMKTILLHQYYTLDHIEWKEALDKSGFSRGEGRKAAKNLKILEDALANNQIKFGGIANAIITSDF